MVMMIIMIISFGGFCPTPKIYTRNSQLENLVDRMETKHTLIPASYSINTLEDFRESVSHPQRARAARSPNGPCVVQQLAQVRLLPPGRAGFPALGPSDRQQPRHWSSSSTSLSNEKISSCFCSLSWPMQPQITW